MKIIVLLIFIAVLFWFFRSLFSKRKHKTWILSDTHRQVLEEQVFFYSRLSAEDKASFEARMEEFLSGITITGVNTTVEDLDRVLIGASAIIPIFSFPNWAYTDINEVLLYPDNFSEDFRQEGGDRAVLGMVGSGAMQGTMILSQHELRKGFSNKTDKSNTAIHEFVHLIDKSDGATDGLPENIIRHQYVVPWLNLMHENIKTIRSGRSDINPYGSTNEAEFFAVVSEYFFERPDLLHRKHPELYSLLEQIFGKKADLAR
ncbi:MAG TPA: M90 family metallopeptidase [Flavisolibacter sp.]|nr:M90 family metallopeptidase [Flavisolibacter sp.]